MSKKESIRLSLEFPIDEHAYLKMMCAKLHVSIKDFVTQAIVRAVEDWEDKFDKESIEQARKEVVEHGTVEWKTMEKELGWHEL